MSTGRHADLPGLEARVFDALDRLTPCLTPWRTPSGALGLAVSGGGDSMALMGLAADWARARGVRLCAVTVDHGLRTASAAEAQAVARDAAALDIPHTVLRAEGLAALTTGPGNLSAAAREARYRLMATWAEGAGLGAVALGHTQDDQVETVLLRLARGAGVDGLSAMQAARDWLGLCWLRPLLEVSRSELRAWLRSRGMAWVEDPTNDDPAYDRVKARQILAGLAPLGITAEGLAETAEILRGQRAALEAGAASLAAQARRWGSYGEARLDPTALSRAPDDLCRRVLADTICRVAGAARVPRHRALAPALQALAAGDIPQVTVAGCLLTAHRGRLLIVREPAAALAAGPIDAVPGALWDRRWRFMGPAQPGLQIRALGGLRPDLLPPAWRTVPALVRQSLPALVDPGRLDAKNQPFLLAIPSLGFLAYSGAKSGAGCRLEWIAGDTWA